MDLLAALVRDLREQAPDHIMCTGDVCNLGLASEWPGSRIFLDGLGTPETVSFVPGNHDAYVPGSLEGLLKAIDPYAKGDLPGLHRFPYIRRRGSVAILGLSSAIPTAPFVASGKLGRTQIKHAEASPLTPAGGCGGGPGCSGACPPTPRRMRGGRRPAAILRTRTASRP